MVLRTPLSRPIPPGCGRVTMTHRSTCLTTSSSAPPSRTRRPTSASSPVPSRTTLARNRRRSQVPSVSVETSDTRVRELSWKAPRAPEKASQSYSPASPTSWGLSYRRSPGASAAARSATGRPSQSDSTASSEVTVPSGSTTSTRPSARGRRERNNRSGTRRAVSPKPVPTSNSAHCRSPPSPSGPPSVLVSRPPCNDLTGYRHSSATRTSDHPGEGPGAGPLGARVEHDEVDVVGQRVRRAGHRLDGDAAPALPGPQRVAGEDLQPRPGAVDGELEAAQRRAAQPHAGPAVGVAVEVGDRGVEGAVADPADRPVEGTPLARREPAVVDDQLGAGGHLQLGVGDAAVLLRADGEVRVETGAEGRRLGTGVADPHRHGEPAGLEGVVDRGGQPERVAGAGLDDGADGHRVVPALEDAPGLPADQTVHRGGLVRAGQLQLQVTATPAPPALADAVGPGQQHPAAAAAGHRARGVAVEQLAVTDGQRAHGAAAQVDGQPGVAGGDLDVGGLGRGPGSAHGSTPPHRGGAPSVRDGRSRRETASRISPGRAPARRTASRRRRPRRGRRQRSAGNPRPRTARWPPADADRSPGAASSSRGPARPPPARQPPASTDPAPAPPARRTS